ncbi:hypothetical protein Dimus_012961 [Dionaea muscipula]
MGSSCGLEFSFILMGCNAKLQRCFDALLLGLHVAALRTAGIRCYRNIMGSSCGLEVSFILMGYNAKLQHCCNCCYSSIHAGKLHATTLPYLLLLAVGYSAHSLGLKATWAEWAALLASKRAID